MVQRFSKDWMVMGRRPSGVCGACLILAARMNNFRRTVTEVVYIVKVTTNTIQKRLEEFKLTPSSSLTVEEFLNNEFLEQAHDPPSFYQKQEEFLKNKQTRKRKRKINNDGEEVDEDDPNSRQTTQDPNADNPILTVELRRDADGFAIPPPRVPPQETPIDPALFDSQPANSQAVDPQPTDSQSTNSRPADFQPTDSLLIDSQSGLTIEQLVDAFGDDLDDPGREDIPTPVKEGHQNQEYFVTEEWDADERAIEEQVSEIISDPNTQEHALAYERAQKRTDAHMAWIASRNLHAKPIPDTEEIDEEEFDNDPEVQNCLLSAADIAAKEKIWVNENRQWLRKQQLKAAAARAAAAGPPKATRIRKKKPRIGEGQTTPASTPGDAAVEVLKTRAWSKKINYNIYQKMFDKPAGYASRLGSAVTSRAGSVALEELSRNTSRATSVASSFADVRSPSRTPFIDAPSGSTTATDSVRSASPVASEADTHDWRAGLSRAKATDEFGEIDDEDVEDDPAMGDIDDIEGGGGFEYDRDEDDYE
jgi:transcription factor IIIB subunit 2